MKKIIALSFLVLTAFACKKEEEKTLETPVPVTQTYPALYAGTGMWNIDRLALTDLQNPSNSDALTNAGTVQFLNDSVMIVNQTGYTANDFDYSVNAAQTKITFYSGSTTYEGPITWTNANKMKFSFDSSEGSSQLRTTFELTRQ